jgi:uncharacterized protein YegP (UPF0339 family)
MSIFFEVYKDKSKTLQPWRFRAKSSNGETMFTSEGYFSKWNAKRAIKRLNKDAEIRER